MLQQTFETRCLSSLSKVFCDEELHDKPFRKASALLGETYSFQVAFRSENQVKALRIRIESALCEHITIRSVGLVPSELPCFEDADENVLRTTPGLYPDPLYPDEGGRIKAFPQQWRSVWVAVGIPETLHPGQYGIRVTFENESDDLLGEETFSLAVIPATLPKQRLIHSEWLHADCISTYYGCPVFSEEHWRRLGQFIETAAAHGINMMLTPLFTPPLDTEVGGERPTVQLVDVVRKGMEYRFRFDRLKRWVDLCTDKGIEYLEFSHLFTQWGAKHAPKIVAFDNGEERRIFGWDTDASGEEYRHFIKQLLPELVRFLKENDLERRSYFHISDEPYEEHLDQYKTVSGMIHEHLHEFPCIDALSDYSFYDKGLVKIPIAANDHLSPFIENGVDPLWTYYCVSQRQKVSNRFFHMPSSRNRIIGIQIYKFGIAGFLHWGYNFWYAQYSKKSIDPFKVTDADGNFPSGDPFLVYPGEQGPIESIRLEVFYEALQDLRALQLLESRLGKEKVIELLEEGLAEPITFSQYPVSSEWLLAIREKINQEIATAIG
ncbi:MULTISPECIES: DUF4091 domain-containing protein [unclassified Paenibacillus]|uniref:DUF4091 domain-containing protein n=1 Tax=unclassified Paenibacillus TaxID=185978 RepID=UPI000954DBE3|nr:MULTISPECIES: DUF4091 domain-containing protein [unclassified Paenibacillus]ASS66143.1 DUF4091 domain-containing protein [Paenibacillus sp. RUD330]SIQ11359.1 protein of unknown function [Paenibacillus sp. RU4X]SIQ32533.1 protein of unknown function [Paenibacillus sp. RU4T]